MTVGDSLCLYDDETQWINIMSFATLTVKLVKFVFRLDKN